MENIRYYPVIDNKPSTEKIRAQIQAQLWTNMILTDNIDDANAILVGWWDGFMLDTIKEYCHLNKIFVWMNYGTLWFLLNKIQTIEELPKTIQELDIIEEVTPKVTINTEDGSQYVTYAINDVVIGKHVLDYFHFDVHHGNEQKSIKWSAFIVSTGIGSTWYRLGNWGGIIPLHSKLRGIMWLAAKPFEYNWIAPCRIHITTHGKQLPDIGVDGYGPGFHKNISDVIIESDWTSIKLWFTKEEEFETRRHLMANQKL